MLDTLSEITHPDIDSINPIILPAFEREAILYNPTGALRVYCRRDCPSLRPHREAARGFASRAEAVEAGLRPCGWCRPDLGRPAGGPRPTAIRHACRTLAGLFGALVFLP